MRTLLTTLAMLFAFGTAAQAAQPCCDDLPCCEEASLCCDEWFNSDGARLWKGAGVARSLMCIHYTTKTSCDEVAVCSRAERWVKLPWCTSLPSREGACTSGDPAEALADRWMAVALLSGRRRNGPLTRESFESLAPGPRNATVSIAFLSHPGPTTDRGSQSPNRQVMRAWRVN